MSRKKVEEIDIYSKQLSLIVNDFLVTVTISFLHRVTRLESEIFIVIA